MARPHPKSQTLTGRREHFQLMLQKFRRTIGVAIVQRNINHNLGRMHYVRVTTKEASNTYRTNHSNYRLVPSQKGGSSWYSAYTSEAYTTFKQFQNEYNCCML
jgi:hypothetical protein